MAQRLTGHALYNSQQLFFVVVFMTSQGVPLLEYLKAGWGTGSEEIILLDTSEGGETKSEYYFSYTMAVCSCANNRSCMKGLFYY